MTLYEFKLLDKEKQYYVTLKQGNSIDHHLELERRFALYAVDKFLIEVEYYVEKNKIINLLSFIEEAILDTYV